MEMKDLCDAIQKGWEDVAKLEKQECDSKPGPPATAEDIQRLVDAHGEHLPRVFWLCLIEHDVSAARGLFG
ncbi:MAG: hypothetical protein JRH20_29685 [Deltaproteobacteria bacterium]|nr:hypothetical protein [Deltaproteobacteria bacterium]